MPFLEERTRAPAFPTDGVWFNVADPIRLEDCRGRVVLLDFWTYCCINCLHVLPDLRFLEAQYGDRLLVIGIHSPKFTQEKKDEQVKLAIQRHDIRHPVLHDASMHLWQAYGIHAWPTLVLLDHQGRVAFATSGEGQRSILASAIDRLLSEAKENRTREFSFPEARPETGPHLCFPTKLAWGWDCLWIADTGHHQLVSVDRSGNETGRWGSGLAGFSDGMRDSACFNEPRGLTVNRQTIWVADTGNHALRILDLPGRTVRTILGDGVQARDRQRPGDSHPLPSGTRLNSPWDLTIRNQVLYLAMAGSHQIWSYDPGHGSGGVLAGTGLEALVDGSYEEAAFAQPSGLGDGAHTRLYVADSESSAIRCLEMERREVTTLVGHGLFDFGDRNGGSRTARLQHPLAVTEVGTELWIADSYNSKIKILDLEKGKIRSLPLDESLNEPEGILATPWGIFVADTNHHRVLHVDPERGSACLFYE
jgi:thiol-disulfide isomerase/thioredoxin